MRFLYLRSFFLFVTFIYFILSMALFNLFAKLQLILVYLLVLYVLGYFFLFYFYIVSLFVTFFPSLSHILFHFILFYFVLFQSLLFQFLLFFLILFHFIPIYQARLLFSFDLDLYVMGHSSDSRQTVCVPLLLPVSAVMKNDILIVFIYSLIYLPIHSFFYFDFIARLFLLIVF